MSAALGWALIACGLAILALLTLRYLRRWQERRATWLMSWVVFNHVSGALGLPTMPWNWRLRWSRRAYNRWLLRQEHRQAPRHARAAR